MTNIKNANIKQNSKESPRNIFSRTETKFDSKLMTMATIMRERLAGVAAGCASLRGRGGGRRLPRFGGWWGFVSGGVESPQGVICHHPRNLVLAQRQQRIAHL